MNTEKQSYAHNFLDSLSATKKMALDLRHTLPDKGQERAQPDRLVGH